MDVHHRPPDAARLVGRGAIRGRYRRLPEKVAIRAVLTDVDLESVKVGMDMEITLAKMKEDEEGNDVVSYKFRPV